MTNTSDKHRRKQFVAGYSLSILSLTISYILISNDSSATGDWILVNLPSAFLDIILGGGLHNPIGIGFYMGVALQWFTIGFYVSKFYYRHLHIKDKAA